MPVRRPRGNRRIDAAIDHFAAMGYAARDVIAVVGRLIKLYGGPSRDVWRLLEEGSYEIVRNRLLEIEDEKQRQDQQLLLEHHQQQDGQQVEDEPPQHQEPAADEEVEDPMFTEPQDTIPMFTEPQDTIPTSNEVPAETKSAHEEVKDPMFIEPPAREAVLPLNAAERTSPRQPCYGWLSESEDEEEEPTGLKHAAHVPSPGE